MNGIRLPYANAAERSLAPRLRTPVIIAWLLLPDVAELEEHDESERGQHEQRDRRALAEIAALQADLVRVRGEQMRRVHRTAARQHVHDIEVVEGEDGGEQDHDREHRL